MTTATRRGPKDKFFRRNAAASVLGIELDKQTWKQLKPLLDEAPTDLQQDYEKLVTAFREAGSIVASATAGPQPVGTPNTDSDSAPKAPEQAKSSGAKQARKTGAGKAKPRSRKVTNKAIATRMAEQAASAANGAK